MRKRTITLLLVGIVLVFSILYAVDFNKVQGVLSKLSVEYFLLLLGIQLLSIFFAALKWRVILKHSKVKLRNLIPATFVGYFINGVTPIGLAGGEPVRAYIISKTDNVPMTTAASSVIVDLFLEITPMFVFSAVSIYLVLNSGVPAALGLLLGIIALALLILFVLAVALVLNKGFSLEVIKALLGTLARTRFLKRYVNHLIPEVEEISHRFNKAIRLHMMDNTILLLGTSLSFIVWSLRFLRTYLIFLGLGFSVDYTTVLIVETAVSVLSFIPLLPGSLGIWEGASTALYTLTTPIGEAAAAAATVLNRFYLFLIPLLIGILAALYLGLNLGKITNSNGIEE